MGNCMSFCPRVRRRLRRFFGRREEPEQRRPSARRYTHPPGYYSSDMEMNRHMEHYSTMVSVMAPNMFMYDLPYVPFRVESATRLSIVYAGFRKSDTAPVFIKCIRKGLCENVVYLNSKFCTTEEAVYIEADGDPGLVTRLDYFTDNDIYYVSITAKIPVSCTLQYLLSLNYNLTTDVARKVIREIIGTVYRLKNKNIAHCNLIPENIVVTTDDFDTRIIGWSNAGHYRNYTDCNVRRSYKDLMALPPEMLLTQYAYPSHVDVWQIGILLYTLVAGEHPFESVKDVITSRVSFKTEVHPLLEKIILWCLIKDPLKRITFEALTQHPWLRYDDAGGFDPNPFIRLTLNDITYSVTQVEARLNFKTIRGWRNLEDEFELQSFRPDAKEQPSAAPQPRIITLGNDLPNQGES